MTGTVMAARTGVPKSKVAAIRAANKTIRIDIGLTEN